MHFFYWADQPSPKLAQLLDSAARNGISPLAIGEGRAPARFHFSLFKQGALYAAVRELPDDALVCATDGFDVFYQRDARYIRETFAKFQADVVFSAERAYSHQYRGPKPYFDQAAEDTPYRYLNAGSVVGYAGALRKIYQPSLLLKLKLVLFRQALPGFFAAKLNALVNRLLRRSESGLGDGVRFLPPHKYTDQAEMARQFAAGSHGLTYALDRRCELFWCTALEWDDLSAHYQVHNGRLVNRHTGTTPAVVHVPWGRYRPEFEMLYEVYRAAVEAEV